MSSALIYTIGYEGATVPKFWAALREYDVELLIDVRSTPWSRKPGFSKAALINAAEENGLRYEHWSAMGCPRDILLAYREDRDWDIYTERFWRYLRTRDEEVITLAELAESKRCCLLCFEADPDTCHRSYVAQYAQSFVSSLEILHINPIEVALQKVNQKVMFAA